MTSRPSSYDPLASPPTVATSANLRELEEATPAPHVGTGSGLRGFAIVTPLIEAWQRIVLVCALAGALTLAIRMVLVKPRYEARATLMTVSSARTPSSASGLAALTALAGQGANAVGPDLVSQILVSRRVLLDVGLSPVDSGSSTRIIDRLAGQKRAVMRQPDVTRALAGVLFITVDRKTGLFDVVAQHTDSALARILVTRDVEIGGRAFASMMRSQASAQREGQEARVRLTAGQLREAEVRQVDFLRSNRSTAPFSETSLQQQAIQRDIQIAQQAYTDAVSAREAAYAKELEETPAVVVVDPVLPELPRVPKYNLFYSLAVGLAAAFAYVTLILIRESLAMMRSDGAPLALRFVSAVRRIPLLGRLAPRD